MILTLLTDLFYEQRFLISNLCSTFLGHPVPAKKSMVVFIPSEIIALKNQEKTKETENFRPY